MQEKFEGTKGRLIRTYIVIRRIDNTVVSTLFYSVKILLFSSARSHDFDGLIGIELPVSMYTTKTPIDLCRFSPVDTSAD